MIRSGVVIERFPGVRFTRAVRGSGFDPLGTILWRRQRFGQPPSDSGTGSARATVLLLQYFTAVRGGPEEELPTRVHRLTFGVYQKYPGVPLTTPSGNGRGRARATIPPLQNPTAVR